MASNEQFMKFVNSELPKRLSIGNMPLSGNLPAGKLLKTTGIGLNLELHDDNPLNQSLIAVYNNTPLPIPLNKVLEVNGAPDVTNLTAIPSVKTIDNIKPDVPVGVLYCQLEDDLTTIKMLDADTKYPYLSPGKVGLAIKVGRAEITGLDTTNAQVGGFVYCTESGDLTTTETELKIGQVLTKAEDGIIYVNIGALASGESSANGGIWISEIRSASPSENAKISEYEYSKDTNDKQVALKGIANTFDIIVKVFAISGHSHYKPRVTVNGTPANLEPGEHPFEWTGEVAITWSLESPRLIATHEDGGKHIVLMEKEEGPELAYVHFLGYPSFQAITQNGNESITQTEVKLNDTVQIRVKIAEQSKSKAYSLKFGAEIANPLLTDACQLTTFTFDTPMEAGEERTFAVKIANRGNVVRDLNTTVVAYTQSGSAGDPLASDVSGTIDGVNRIKCNNISPVIATQDIQYPQTTVGGNTVLQKALAENESASWQTNITNRGLNPILRYQIINSAHLNYAIGDDFYFETFAGNEALFERELTCVGNDVINLTIQNIAIHVYRRENGAYAMKSECIKIADKSADVVITEESERLRADFTVNGRVTYVRLVSDQPLFEAPILHFDSMDEAPLWDGDWVSDDNGAGRIWKRYFRIKKTTSKGTFYWRNLTAKNLALVETTIPNTSGTNNNTYIVGGFVMKELQIPAWSGIVNPVAIDIDIANVNKLVCTNLSKGDSGSKNYSYQSFPVGTNIFYILENLSNIDTYLNKYTATDQNGIVVAKPTHWVNLDIKNASSNTTGEMKIEIEEII